MSKEIINQFLEQFSILTDYEKRGLAEKLNIQSFKEKEIIQEYGKIPTHCFCVLQGLVRQYEIIEGIEKTTEIYSESHPAISSEYYSQNIPSKVILECSEPSILIVGDRENDLKLIKEFPVLQTIMMQMIEKEWEKSKQSLTDFKTSSPEQRYLNFLNNRKDLLNRVPNTQIASYLGITPESLSRIKKRIFTKEKNK